MSDAPYVFLSYASADRDRALAIADALERAGVRVWLDRSSIAAGTSWGEEIVEGIKGCAALLIVCTGAAMQSRNVRQEIQLAWRYERPYVPLLLEPVAFPEQVQYFLEGYQWVEALDRPEADWLPALLAALARLGVASATPAADATPTAPPRSPSASAAPAPARGAFVGREAELGRLRAALDAAVAGDGRLVLLAGEPGIGKTRLGQALADEAAGRGCLVLWGRCWEGEGAPAFWPWMQAVGAYARGQEPEALRRALGRGAADIAHLVPEVAALLPDVPPPPPADPEAARFRLFGGVASFLAALAAERPLVLVLDDLHWADKPSLLLLQYLARELPGSRILALGTYRDTDLDRRHPLDEALTSLRREAAFERVALRGLTEDEVVALMEARAGHALDAGGRALADAIARETEGNPFFVEETLRHLAETGALRLRDGRWEITTGSIAELGIPEGVRQVIGRRLSRLSDETNALLAVAAVIGREFDADVLERIGGGDADAVDAALASATAAALVAEPARAGGRYRFTHALVRETLLRELPLRRRARLHRQAGAALEAHYGARAARHASELAHHFGEAAGGDDALATKAAEYSRLAAEQAESATAWESAAQHYERCLSLMADAGDGLGQDEAALLEALGRCRSEAAERRAAFREFMRAIDRYLARGDGVGVARVTVQLLTIPMRPERRLPLIDRALAALGDADPALEGQLLMERSEPWVPLPEEQKRAAEDRARALADRYDLPALALDVRRRQAVRLARETRLEEALAVFREVRLGTAALGIGPGGFPTYGAEATVAYLIGDLDRADAIAEEIRARAIAGHLVRPDSLMAAMLSGVRLIRGDAAGCEALLRRCEPGLITVHARRADLAMSRGEADEAMQHLPSLDLAGGLPQWIALGHGARARIRFQAGDVDGARAELAGWWGAIPSLPRSEGGRLHYGMIYVAAEPDEALPSLGDGAMVRWVYDALGAWSVARYESSTARSLDRIRGMLAARLGLLDDAEAHLHDGLAWAERERCPVERGRCLQGLAEVAQRRGQHAEARGHLDRAATLFERHGAILYLRQVDHAREALAP